MSRTLRFRALLLHRCPRCLRGRLFRGPLAMNERCPVCGLRFAREPGYFLGAMYVSYAIGIPLLLGLVLLWYLVLPAWPWHWLLAPALVCFLPLLPLIFRYSRTVWVHFDRRIDPGGEGD